MNKLILVVVLLTLALPPAFAADTTELARQVRETEIAFATTMADRDWAAFKAFISPKAVFFGRRVILRGRPGGYHASSALHATRPADVS